MCRTRRRSGNVLIWHQRNGDALPGWKRPTPYVTFLYALRLCAVLTSVLLIQSPIPARSSAPAGLIARIDSLNAAALDDSARKLIEEHLPAVRAGRDSTLLLSLLARRGRFLAFYDRTKEAEPVLIEAVSLAEGLKDSANLCLALRWLGVSVDSQGRRAEAQQVNRRLLELTRAVHDRNTEGWALFGLAWEALEGGQAEEAVRSYQLALGLFRETRDARGEIWALNGLGSAAQRSGDLSHAGEYYEKSRRRAIEAKNSIGELRAMNSQGSLEFVRGDPAKAMEAFRRVHELQTGLGNIRESIIPALNVAVCQTHLGQYREAEERLLKNLSICRTEGWRDLEFKLMNQLILVKDKLGAHREAARLCRECLSVRETLPIQTRVMMSVALSSQLEQMDSTAAGLAVLEETENEVGKDLRADLAIVLRGARGLWLLDLDRPSEALPLLRFVDAEAARAGLSKHRIHALAKAAAAYRKLGQPDSSLACLERACLVWEVERRIPASLDWRESRGISGQMVFADLAMELIDRSPDCGAAEAFDRLQVFKARTFLERMQGPRPAVPEETPPAEVIGAEELQKDVLRPGDVFLDCYVGPEKSLVFAVTREEVRWASMPPESLLATRISAYREILTAETTFTALDRTVAAIDSTLFDGVAELLRGKERIFISPDGPLHLVPFGIDLAPPGVVASGSRVQARWIRIPSATVLSVIRSGRGADSGRPRRGPRIPRPPRRESSPSPERRGRTSLPWTEPGRRSTTWPLAITAWKPGSLPGKTRDPGGSPCRPTTSSISPPTRGLWTARPGSRRSTWAPMTAVHSWPGRSPVFTCVRTWSSCPPASPPAAAFCPVRAWPD